MLTGIALIIIFGLLLGAAAEKLRLPPLVGMIAAGILFGPHALGLIDGDVIGVSAQLRQAALVTILMRAGLSLDINDLRRVGRPAALMCFVPACFEIFGTVLIAPRVFGITTAEAAVMGSTIAAVSPAVIVPRMIKLMDGSYGSKNSIPQLILAGASIDDVFVIVVFTAMCTLAGSGTASAADFLEIPVSIILGAAAGVSAGALLTLMFKRLNIRGTVKLLIVMSVSFLMLELERRLDGIVAISGLIAVMSIGLAVNKLNKPLAVSLSSKYAKLWVGAEIVLFVLVGAEVDLRCAVGMGAEAATVILGALAFRMAGVAVCTAKTALDFKERLFCMIAYTPKATVQAAIGALPLSMGLACGNAVLTAAVVSILITAPLGAIGIDTLYKKLLDKV